MSAMSPFRLLVPLLLLAVLSAGAADTNRAEMTEVTGEQMDTRMLSDLGRRVLAAREFKWRHGQTDHFVVHFENGIFAAKVARMGESFYRFIAEDLQGAKDRVDGRSHIYIFRNQNDWDIFIKRYYQGELEWAFSMVTGPIMYLQQAGDLSSSAEVLGHEMTHLVVNRFLEGQLPLWLNEGLAEWYGEFAYAAFKGVKKSKRSQFQGLRSTYPVAELLGATAYPAERKKVHEFYHTSKHLVGYLQLEKSPEAFLPFARDLAGGAEVGDTLKSRYSFAGVEDLAAQFEKFRR